jgi:hypothetical protein
MADYYPLIAKAVVGQSSGEARRVLYDRARAALVGQLRGVDPPLAEADITRERLALEEAIRKVESDAARRARADQPAREAPPPRAAPPPPRPDVPPSPRGRVPPPAMAPEPGGPAHMPGEPPMPPGLAMPPEVPAERPRRGAPGPIADRGPIPVPKRDPLAPLPPKGPSAGPAMVEPPPAADFGAGELRPPGREPRPPGRRGEPPPPFFDAPESGEADADPGLDEPLAPPPGMRKDERGRGGPPRGPDSRRDGRPDKGAIKSPEPRSETGRRGDRFADRPGDRPQDRQRERAGLPVRRIAIASAAVLLLLAVVAAGLWYRSAIVGYFAGAPTASRAVDSGAKPKIADRIGASTADDGAPVAQKVVLYEEDPNDAAGKRYVGTAVWRLEAVPPAAGKPPDLAIRADIEIPDQKLSARWSLRRNDDKSLPASHTVEVMFTLPPDFPHKGITNIPGVLMKQSESTRGVPLAGLAVKVTNNFFLIGLSSVDADRQRNIQLLKERAWFDIPLVYEDGRRAILAIEKGTPGERAFAKAFEAWGQ